MRNFHLSGALLGLLAIATVRPASAAPALTVGSVSGNPGTDVTLPVTLTPGTIGVAGVQFDLILPTALSSGPVTAGAAATAAGKATYSNFIAPSTLRVMVVGFNLTTIGAGTVALVTLHISAGAPNGPLPVGIQNIVYSDPSGYEVTGDPSTGGTVTVVGGVSRPVITSSLMATTDLGVAFSYNITATNSPTSYSASGLPAGLSVNTATGLISGTPTATGIFSVTLGATNAAGTGTDILTLVVRTPASLTLTKSASPMTATSGTTVTFTIQYQNIAAGPASNVVVADVIPTGSTFVTGSLTGGGTISGNTITWNLGSVAGGASGNVTFQVRIN